MENKKTKSEAETTEKNKLKFTDKKVLIPIISVASAIVLFFGGMALSLVGDGIRSGVKINGVEVGGMSKEKATEAVNQYISDELMDNTLEIEYEGNLNQYEFTELITGYDVDGAVEEAYNIGRGNNFFTDAFESIGVRMSGKTISVNPVFDDTFIVEFTEKYAAAVADGVEENTYSVQNDKLVFVNGKTGYSIDSEKAFEQIKNALTSAENEKIVLERALRDPKPFDAEKIYSEVCTPPVNAGYKIIDGRGYLEEAKNGYNFNVEELKTFLEENKTNTEKYEFPLEVVEPEIKKADTSGLFPDVLATYTSKITDKNRDRQANVKLAAQKIDGVILNPDEVFAYLSHVEPITIAGGYKVANVYANGTVTQDVGGGVCQVSSALYSAVLYADLEVTKRYAHSLTVAYVPYGMDATVASGEIDFRFKNNTDAPLMIKAKFTETDVTVTLLGEKKDKDLTIEIENVTVQTLYPQEEITEDPSLPAGERKVDYGGKNGYVVQTYKKYIRNGVVEKTEHVAKSTYKARNKTVRVGVGEAVETVVPPVETPVVEGNDSQNQPVIETPEEVVADETTETTVPEIPATSQQDKPENEPEETVEEVPVEQVVAEEIPTVSE